MTTTKYVSGMRFDPDGTIRVDAGGGKIVASMGASEYSSILDRMIRPPIVRTAVPSSAWRIGNNLTPGGVTYVMDNSTTTRSLYPVRISMLNADTALPEMNGSSLAALDKLRDSL